jgi:hypothetical protein
LISSKKTETNKESHSKKENFRHLGLRFVHAEAFMQMVMEDASAIKDTRDAKEFKDTEDYIDIRETNKVTSEKTKTFQRIAIRLHSEISQQITSYLIFNKEKTIQDQGVHILNKKIDRLLECNFLLILPLILLFIFAADKSSLFIIDMYVPVRIVDFLRRSTALVRLGAQAEDLLESESQAHKSRYTIQGAVIHGNALFDLTIIGILIARIF